MTHGRTNTIEYAMLKSAKTRAAEANIPFSITLDDIFIPERCPLLGLPLQRNKGAAGANSPSLDRIMPEIGYVPRNVQVISYRANTLKRDATFSEFERIYLAWKSQRDEFDDLL